MNLSDFVGAKCEYSHSLSVAELSVVKDTALAQGFTSLEELILCAHWEDVGGRKERALGVLITALQTKARATSLCYTLFAKLQVREPRVILDHYLDYLVGRRRLPPVDLLDLTECGVKLNLRGTSLSASLTVGSNFVFASRVASGGTKAKFSQLEKVIFGYVEP
nr:MAG: hypothetical protein [Grapevine virus M]